MNELTITINNIEYDLEERQLDPEYIRSLGRALMKLGYINDYPINMYLGTIEQEKEIERVYHMPLKAKQLKGIINFMSKEMKDDSQYKVFKPIELYYLSLADELKKQERRVR